MILEVGDEPRGRSRSLLDAKEGENLGKEKLVGIYKDQVTFGLLN